METSSPSQTVGGVFRPDLLRETLIISGVGHSRLPFVFRSGRGALAGALVFFSGLGFLAGALLPFRGPVSLGVAIGLALGVLWLVDLQVLGTLPPTAAELLLVSFVAFIGAALGLFDRRHGLGMRRAKRMLAGRSFHCLGVRGPV